MSIHRSFKQGSGIQRHRNVLSRRERIDKLLAEERWNEEDGVYGLPKVRNIKPKAGKKKKVKEEDEEETEEAAGEETAAS